MLVKQTAFASVTSKHFPTGTATVINGWPLVADAFTYFAQGLRVLGKQNKTSTLSSWSASRAQEWKQY